MSKIEGKDFREVIDKLVIDLPSGSAGKIFVPKEFMPDIQRECQKQWYLSISIALYRTNRSIVFVIDENDKEKI